MIKCNTCFVQKELSEFPKRKDSTYGVRLKCKVCQAAYQKAHKNKNIAYYRNYWKEYFAKRYTTEIQFKLRNRIRKTASRYPASKGKWSSTKSLGCTSDELRVYLESKFSEGMSWENYGKWHIDHIKPLSKFDLNDELQFNEACHYTNLQPLWAIDNIMKGDSC